MSGTRGPVDFVETPSHLMEYFVRDHRSLSTFAHHYVTGESVPADKVDILDRARGMFSNLEKRQQASGSES